MKTGIEIIAEERQRQMDQEGFSIAKDNHYNSDGQLAKSAAAYAWPSSQLTLTVSDDMFVTFKRSMLWPSSWSKKWWKPSPSDRIRDLAKAGALIAAEIDRLQNKYIVK